MSATHISDAEFESQVLKATTPVLVDFYAEWCGPCKAAGPILDKMADELVGKVSIVKMDIDANANTPAKFGVMSIPTVILFKDGKEVERKVGFGGEQGYRNLLAKVSIA